MFDILATYFGFFYSKNVQYDLMSILMTLNTDLMHQFKTKQSIRMHRRLFIVLQTKYDTIINRMNINLSVCYCQFCVILL